jgi:hypothetical protein
MVTLINMLTFLGPFPRINKTMSGSIYSFNMILYLGHPLFPFPGVNIVPQIQALLIWEQHRRHEGQKSSHVMILTDRIYNPTFKALLTGIPMIIEYIRIINLVVGSLDALKYSHSN